MATRLLALLTLTAAKPPVPTHPDGDLSIPPGVGSAGCRFPESMQGLYLRQDDTRPPSYDSLGMRSPVKYEEYFIGPTAIPHWGDCYTRHHSAFVLGIKKVGGYVCYRCFNMAERTENILQIVVSREDLCYRSVDAATGSCVPVRNITSATPSIVLWRAENRVGEYCPLGGLGRVGYEGGGGRLSCPLPSPSASSTIDNCRQGDQLKLSLRGCTFPAIFDTTFDCLGSWESGRPGERFFGLYNRLAEEFRCGMYSEEENDDGEVTAFAAFSNDSTCHHRLQSSKIGFEIFTIQKVHPPPWPLQAEEGCEFPEWMRGDWELMTVTADMLSYFHHHDPSTMSTLYAKCVRRRGHTLQILTRNHCGESGGYTCLRMERRSGTVLEMQMGTGTRTHYDATQCDADDVFDDATWTTIASRQRTPERCTFDGRYTSAGATPEGHCFTSATDCDRPSIFRFTGSLCDTGTVFQSDTYECLGSWDDNGTSFTYVRREQDGVNGCFASKMEMSGRLSLAWTGKDCDRHFDFYAEPQPTAPSPQPTSGTLPTLIQLQQAESCAAVRAVMVAGEGLRTMTAPVFRARPPDLFSTPHYPPPAQAAPALALPSLLVCALWAL